jgi:hypothetical protein
MPLTTRALGFTTGVQRLVWSGPAGIATAHLWGGGGGRGGSDAAVGGNGSGAGYSTYQFAVTDGDVLDVAVGGPGGNGLSGVGGFGGGSAGASLAETSLIFNTRTAVASPPVGVYFDPNWGSFLNTYGIWEAGSAGFVNFERTYSVNFPSTGLYTFTFSVDNYGDVSVDGAVVISLEGKSRANFLYSYQTTVSISAGFHNIRVRGVNTGGPGSIAVTITGGTTFSGGRGGNPGPSGSSGGGGGGGGATVLLLNNTVVAAAAGGGGGGGGGRFSSGSTAPGSNGTASSGIYAGQNGQDHPGDGGGGGGGGGGWQGGNGGPIRGGDDGAFAGSVGLSSPGGQNPVGTVPGGTNSAYYKSGIGQGASASQPSTGGYATISFETTGTNINVDGNYVSAIKTYIKDSGVWKEANTIWINDNGIWKPVDGGVPPLFSVIPNTIGVNSRPYT